MIILKDRAISIICRHNHHHNLTLSYHACIYKLQRSGLFYARLIPCTKTQSTENLYSASGSDLNKPSASEASIRLDGTNLINFRITRARRVRTRFGSLLLSLLSSSDTWLSFSQSANMPVCIKYAQCLSTHLLSSVGHA